MSIWTNVVGAIEYCSKHQCVNLDVIKRTAPSGSDGSLNVSFIQHEYFATLTVCGMLRDFSDKDEIYKWWRSLHCANNISMSVLRVNCDLDDHDEIYTTCGSKRPDPDDYPVHKFLLSKVEHNNI